jgi:hypothetical protein
VYYRQVAELMKQNQISRKMELAEAAKSVHNKEALQQLVIIDRIGIINIYCLD